MKEEGILIEAFSVGDDLRRFCTVQSGPAQGHYGTAKMIVLFDLHAYVAHMIEQAKSGA